MIKNQTKLFVEITSLACHIYIPRSISDSPEKFEAIVRKSQTLNSKCKNAPRATPPCRTFRPRAKYLHERKPTAPPRRSTSISQLSRKTVPISPRCAAKLSTAACLSIPQFVGIVTFSSSVKYLLEAFLGEGQSVSVSY
jgi:hypothetical protein